MLVLKYLPIGVESLDALAEQIFVDVGHCAGFVSLCLYLSQILSHSQEIITTMAPHTNK